MRAQEEEEAPATLPVPTPPPMQPCVECGNDYAEGYCPHGVKAAPDAFRPKMRRGYDKPFAHKPKPAKRAQPTINELLGEIEKRGGNVQPELVMLVLRAYRSLESTNRALKDQMKKHVEALKAAKKTVKR